MKINPCSFRIWSLLLLGQGCSSFLLYNSYSQSTVWLQAVNDDSATTENKAMSFLKKIGKVGGAANKDFALAVGIDEGGGKSSASGSSLKKSKSAYESCIKSGVIDDLSETFPTTSSGTQWSGFTDRVMGGRSDGNLARENYKGRKANVLRGHVSLENNGGFIQMATNLAQHHAEYDTVDASPYDGIELDVLCKAQDEEHAQFNVHLKTKDCPRPFSSYRATFCAPTEDWNSVRIPWSSFRGHGPGATENSFDVSSLRRAGIVAIGKDMRVTLALSGFRFYKDQA